MPVTCERLLQILWQMSWQAAVIAIGVLALQQTVGRFISHRWRHALWMLVLLRLMMPVLPHSRLGLLPINPPASGDEGISVPTQRFAAAPQWVVGTSQADLPAVSRPRNSVVVESTSFWRMPIAWVIAWLSIAFVLMAVRVGANARFHRRLLREIEPAPERVTRSLNAARGRLRMRRAPALCVTPLVDAPAVTGFLRSRILLPANSLDRLSDNQLNLILLHELSHIACGDVAVDWLWAVLTSLHWFNPILWAIGPIRRNDRELARDEMVLSLSDNPLAYGQLLIDLSQSARRPAFCPGLIGMMSRKNRLARRVQMVARFNGNRWYSNWIGVVLFAVTGGCMLTAPAEKPPAPGPNSSSLSIAGSPATMPVLSDSEDDNGVDVQDDPITDQDRATVTALQQKIDANFNAARFSDVVSSLAEKTHLKVFVDWRYLQNVNVRPDSLVTARFRSIKCSKAFFLIFKSVEDEDKGRLGIGVDGGGVTVTTQRELDKNVVTRRYDIGDLVIDRSTWTNVPESHAAAAARAEKLRESLIASIRKYITDNVEFPTWKDHGGETGIIASGSLRGVLLITQTPRAHRKIQRVLESLRAGVSLQVSIATRIISLPADVEGNLPESLRGHLAAARDAGPSGRDQFLSDAEVQQLLRCVEQHSSAIGLTAPRLTLWAGQTGTLVVQTQQAYVADIRKIPASTTQPAHDEPITKSTNAAGVTLTVMSVPTPDRKTIDVDLHLREDRLIRLMSEQFGPDPSAGTIQRPVTEVLRVDNAYAIPDRSTLLLGCTRTIDAGDVNFNADSPD
jgi:beta-lactamase regulating signal transducer with metallopeptidase domain